MTAKIHNEKVTSDVYHRTMELPITVTQHELLSLALKLRAQVVDATLNICKPALGVKQA